MIDFEAIINTYRAAYKRELAGGCPIKADAFGRRLTHWIQVAEANGVFTDVGSAFNNGRTKLDGNVLVLS